MKKISIMLIVLLTTYSCSNLNSKKLTRQQLLQIKNEVNSKY